MSQIVLDRNRFTCYGGATNGSFTASSETNLELISSHSTGATFDIEGYSGVTSCTISAGVYDIVLHIPQWDGTGEVSSKSNRTFHFQYPGSLTSKVVQTPAVNLNSIGCAYLGSSAVTAIYLGADMIYSASTAPAPSGDRTLVVQGVQEAMMDLQDRYCQMSNIFDFASTYDSMTMEPNNSLITYSPFSGSYADGEITVTGPFSGSEYTVHCEGIGMSACESISHYITFSFSASSATIQAEYTSETDPECECISMGGVWDGENCNPAEEPPIEEPPLEEPPIE